MVFKLSPISSSTIATALTGISQRLSRKSDRRTATRAWETWMTMNDSWGYQVAGDNWKSTKTTQSRFLPAGRRQLPAEHRAKPDGSIPERPCVRILTETGKWMRRGAALYGAEDPPYADFSRRGSTLYIHVHCWPAQTAGTETMAFEHPPTV